MPAALSSSLSSALSSALSWLVFGLSCALVAAGGALGGADPVDAAVALGFTPLGAYLTARRRGGAVGPCCLVTALGAVAYFADSYALRPGLPGGRWAAWVGAWAWAPALLTVGGVLLLLVPDGHLPGRAWRPVAATGVAATAAFTVVAALVPEGPDRPFPVEALAPVREALPAVIVLLAAVSLACAAGLVVRTARAQGERRTQLLWICLGAGAFVAGVFLPAVTRLPAAGVPFILALPACVGVAMLRHDLYGTGPWLRRVLTLGLLTGALALLYFTVSGLTGAHVAAAAAVAVAVEPLHRWLRRASGRILYGGRADPETVHARLGARLAATSEPAEILAAVADAAAEATRAAYVRAELGAPGEPLKVAERGTPAPLGVSVPLRFQDEVLGVLGLSGGDVRVLTPLASHAGAALAAAHRAAALQRSRTLLVTAREEERRRFSRDLHDGLGAFLAGIGFTVDAAGNALTADPERVRGLLTQIRTQVAEAGSGVRRLVRGLRPPELAQLGLAGAVEHTAATLGAGGVEIDVTAADVSGLPAAVEVTAYLVAREALTNAVRHGEPRRCAVRLGRTEDGTGFELGVRDDGRGLPPEAVPGVGLTSMRERVEELDGKLTIDAAPGGGTVVTAWIPL
ncbi:sensor histidine kinase [Microbispora cellulosiformans]|uniref:Oxygen sensor histidine kinase NreB n=1 Tax=Microbispora cellulosiformans TaxID=2614688 RepID=A0A5J5K761_9ACTN|nr:sensor histidine kinase [Microbispora cellulosiformans]KAA9380624.1 sensor histidine kinase [Microbispora cellulosiformans]